MPRRHDQGAPLEVIPLDDVVDGVYASAYATGGGGVVRSRRGGRTRPVGRWLLVLAVMVAVGVIIVGPLRARSNARALKKAAEAFAVYQGYEERRVSTIDELNAAAVPDDRPLFDTAARALADEEAGHVRQLAVALAVPLGADDRLRSSVGEIRRALLGEAEALRAGTDGSAASVAAVDGAASALGAELARMGQQLPKIVAPPLHSADALLAHLRSWTDQPTGLTLIVSDGSTTLQRLDVDHSRSTAVALGELVTMPGEASSLIGRRGWTADVDGIGVIVVPEDGDGSPSPLAPAFGSGQPRGPVVAIAAERADALWLIEGRRMVEVDRHGSALSPVWTLPPYASAIPVAVTGGFVLSTPVGVLVFWNPVDGRLRPISGVPAQLLAARGVLVAWHALAPTAAPIHITDLATGNDQPTTTTPNLDGVDDPDMGCAFSPDDALVACPDLTSGSVGQTDAIYRVMVIDVAAGSARVVAGGDSSVVAPRALVWTSDSQRLCFVTRFGLRTIIATWSRNTPAAVEIRYQTPPSGFPGGPGAVFGLAVISP